MRRRFFLALFDQLYTRFAWGYDLAGWLASAGLWYRWVEQVLPHVEAGPVLEVGFGRGHLLATLAARGFEAVGVDWSMQMAEHVARAGLPVVRGDGRHLPFPDAHFSTLVTTFPAPYILEPTTQRELARVTRPGGLWLWVDAPAFRPVALTLPARLLGRLAWGAPVGDEEQPPAPLLEDRSGDQWAIEARRVVVGPSTVTLRLARRR